MAVIWAWELHAVAPSYCTNAKHSANICVRCILCTLQISVQNKNIHFANNSAIQFRKGSAMPDTEGKIIVMAWSSKLLLSEWTWWSVVLLVLLCYEDDNYDIVISLTLLMMIILWYHWHWWRPLRNHLHLSKKLISVLVSNQIHTRSRIGWLVCFVCAFNQIHTQSHISTI